MKTFNLQSSASVCRLGGAPVLRLRGMCEGRAAASSPSSPHRAQQRWLAGSETTFQTQRVAMRCPLSCTGCQIPPWLQHVGTSRCFAAIDSRGDSSSKRQSEERQVWKKTACKRCLCGMANFAQLLFNTWLKLGNPSPVLFLLFSLDVLAGYATSPRLCRWAAERVL